MLSSVELANRVRKHALQMTNKSGASHIGAIFSVADIISVLYTDILTVFPENDKDERRDRFILSKGHAGVAVYAILAELGFFDQGMLDTYYQNGSKLSGHISHRGVPGVELSTGSLGHGVCVAAGMALAAKYNKQTHQVVAVMGDGECQEGSVWEMAMFAAHQQLNNLTVVIDHNKLQSLDTLENTMSIRNLADRWSVFGWKVTEVDGHNHHELRKVLGQEKTTAPNCIIAHTVKGKGVSFMENEVLWHYRDPQGAFFEQAMTELKQLG